MSKTMTNNKGFTLIELMIVVAIIGILAAIAIPQFSAYRMRGFNASALSDVRGLATSQAALSSDWQRFGTTQANAGVFAAAAPAAGAAVTGGDANGDGISTADTDGTPRGVPLSVGKDVTICAVTNPAVPTAAAPPTAFNAQAKHISADTTFAVDSDVSTVYQHTTLIAVGTALAAGDVVAAVPSADEYAPIALWVAK